MDDIPEDQLVRLAQQEDVEAFTELARLYQGRIYNLILGLTKNHCDADDLSQETFMTAYKSLRKFKQDSSFYTWLYRIAVNRTLNYFKRTQRGVRANINMLRLARMVQALDLTEEQVAVIMPEMNKNEKEKQELQRNLQLKMRDLRLLLRGDNPDELKLKEHLSSIKMLRRTLQEKEAEFDMFLIENLSLVQHASYIIFSQEFYRGLQQQLDNARRTQQRSLQVRRKKR